MKTEPLISEPQPSPVASPAERTHPFAELHPAEVAEMNAFFEGRQLPPVQLPPVQLGPGCRVENPALFVESHLRIINRGRGERMTRPYFERLGRYREVLKGEKK